MKILIFSTAYLPYIGGAEIAVKEITQRLEHQFEMITVRLNNNDAAQEQIGNIKVYRLGFGLGRIDKYLFPFRAARLAAKLHQQNHYDIVWSIMASFSGFAALLVKKKNPPVKFLLTLQEGDDLRVPVRKSLMVHHWFKQIFTRADYIQCISNYLAAWAREMKATCPVEVIPNGVDLDKFTSIDFNPGRETLRKKLNIQPEDTVLISTSRLVPKNGLEDLIDATKNLVDSGYKVITIILGDGPLKNKLKERILNYQSEGATLEKSKIGQAQRIVLFGVRSREDVIIHLQIADIFIRPSLSEGLGNSFLEAMAVGLPVIATPVGGIPDFLEDGKTGWFCAVNNPQSIAEKIKYILDPANEAEVARVVVNAKKLVEEKYNWDKIAGQMEKIFNTLL